MVSSISVLSPLSFFVHLLLQPLFLVIFFLYAFAFFLCLLLYSSLLPPLLRPGLPACFHVLSNFVDTYMCRFCTLLAGSLILTIQTAAIANLFSAPRRGHSNEICILLICNMLEGIRYLDSTPRLERERFNQRRRLKITFEFFTLSLKTTRHDTRCHLKVVRTSDIRGL